ncbi:MAG: hypothetical protein H0X40_17415 [Chthoniobacterales bacterium]|nr:hypothetical protein [Chthoniobacterales bacterium]
MKLVLAGIFVLALFASSLGAEREDESDRFTESDLPSLKQDPAGSSEIDEFARARGFHYARDTRRAARGDFKALKKFFEIAHDADGAARESIAGVPTAVYHLLGDEKLAQFLAGQPVAYRMMVRNLILGDGRIPAENMQFSRDFPESAPLLFPRELVAWFSPNDQYAIRKVFSDPFVLAGSKVVRAELIEKQSGKVLCDLTPDDIGTGADREGEATWSPDSKRVACLSIDLPDQPGHLFSNPRPPVQRKQTVVYQLAGDVFARVELSLGKAPGQDNDPELKGASPGHIYTEPVRWQKPNVLVLRRHEYYGVKKPMTIGGQTFETIADLARQYQITATVEPDGKGKAVWKLQPDR